MCRQGTFRFVSRMIILLCKMVSVVRNRLYVCWKVFTLRCVFEGRVRHLHELAAKREVGEPAAGRGGTCMGGFV